MEFNFNGKKALVTGGGSGLGRKAISFAGDVSDYNQVKKCIRKL